MIKKLLCISVGLVLNVALQAQITINVTPELGIYKRLHSNMNPVDKKMRPLVGLETRVVYHTNFFASIGVQYNVVKSEYSGAHNHYFFDSTRVRRLQRSESLQGFEFHKINVPILFGYKFNFKHIQPSVFIGYKPNFLFNGEYYKEEKISIEGQGVFVANKANLNPINMHEMTIRGARNNGYSAQFTIGASIAIEDRLEFAFTYNKGRTISGVDIVNVPANRYAGDEFIPNYYFFTNSELLVSIKYRFNVFKKG